MTAKVIAVLSRWSSCACNGCTCFEDMAEVLLSNKDVVTTTYTNEGAMLYFYEDLWHTTPPECPFNGCSEEYCACREGLNSAPCEEHMMHQDEGGRCLSCGYGY